MASFSWRASLLIFEMPWSVNSGPRLYLVRSILSKRSISLILGTLNPFLIILALLNACQEVATIYYMNYVMVLETSHTFLSGKAVIIVTYTDRKIGYKRDYSRIITLDPDSDWGMDECFIPAWIERTVFCLLCQSISSDVIKDRHNLCLLGNHIRIRTWHIAPLTDNTTRFKSM